jgi:hypothetical protein
LERAAAANGNDDWASTKIVHLMKNAVKHFADDILRRHDTLTAELPAPYFSLEDGISGYASRAIPGRI